MRDSGDAWLIAQDVKTTVPSVNVHFDPAIVGLAVSPVSATVFRIMLKLFLPVVMAGLQLSSLAAVKDFDFGVYPVGHPPPGFRSAVAGNGQPGDWKVINEKVPPLMAPLSHKAQADTFRPVLAQMAKDPTDEHFAVLLYTNEDFGDFTLTTRFKTVSGVTEQMAGIVFRAQDEKNYYVIRASSLGNTFKFYKMVNGLRSEPMGPEATIPTGEWHTLKVECIGSSIRGYLDDRLLIPPPLPGKPTNNLALNDTSFPHGQIGFWTKSDSVSYFVDTHIDYVPREKFAQVLVRDIMRENPKLLGLRIYAKKKSPLPLVIADNDETAIGTEGTEVEGDVLEKGHSYYLKEGKSAEVTIPLRDRNGEVVGAVRVKLKTFKGEMQETVLTRAMLIKKQMEEHMISAQDINE